MPCACAHHETLTAASPKAAGLNARTKRTKMDRKISPGSYCCRTTGTVVPTTRVGPFPTLIILARAGADAMIQV